MSLLSRRDCLTLAAGSLVTAALPKWNFAADAAPKSVAAVVTIYRHRSHADVILGKILEGWKQDGGPGPALKLASMYVDQFPKDDMARAMSQKHGVPIFDTIEKAITVGGDRIPVDGVISIGEHGDYPHNELGQHLYPRRRFFTEIAATMEKYGRIVPVFNDKHLSTVWADGLWIYNRSKELKIPFMAGSSMPVGYRLNDITVPMGCEMEPAVGIGYSGLDVYGFHALEFYQYHVERRRGAEQGVKSVQFLSGQPMWDAVDAGVVSREAFEAAFGVVPKQGTRDPRQDKEACLFLFDYVDGFRGALFMLGCVQGTSVGLKLKGQSQPLATAFDERSEPHYPHFAHLVRAIERMMHTGRPTYPVERTLLTGGILDRALTSRYRNGVKLDTPELAIRYEPVDYPHAGSGV